MTARRNKTKIPGRAGAKARLTVLLIFAIIGALASFLTLPEYTEKLGAARAIPEAFAGCAVIFLVGAFFWGFLKWISVVGKKTLQSVRWVWDNWETYSIFGFIIKGILWLFCHFAPTAAFGLLFSPLMSLSWKLAENGISVLIAIPLFLGSSALVIGMLVWDFRKLAALK